MHFQYLIFVGLVVTLAADTLAVDAKTEQPIEDSTESPIADLVMTDSEMKTSTEKAAHTAELAQKAMPAMKSEQPQNAQPHTVADFIIHPLIALKPRSPEENLTGRQSSGSSSTTPSPWTLFGLNAGQGLGSSVSSLAGSVSGWLTDRIQLPGLVESPVRESTSTSTTTTTTPRPDVIVRVQQKPTTRRPLISITNKNRPQSFHNNNNNLNFGPNEDDDDDLDDQFEDEEEEEIIRNKKKRKNNNNQNTKRKPYQEEEEDIDDEEEEEDEDDRPVRISQQKRPQKQRRRRPIAEDELSEEEVDNDDESDSAENENEDEENVEDEEIDENYDEEETRRHQSGVIVRRIQNPAESEEIDEDVANEHFYYGSQIGRPSTKRSQKETTLFQRGQENIINQLRQLTRGRTPAEIGALVNKSPKKSGSKQRRRQQTTLLVNRNGQTIYLAPELLNVDLPLVKTQVKFSKQDATQYPQPPLTVPLKRKNAPTQYITIPWSQLGISPPNRLHSITEGIQTQPLILNIPASAIQTMQDQSLKRKKQPVLTAEAVPLLAEASIMDVFKPPTIPHDRDSADASAQKPITAGSPVIIASKKKPATSSNTITTAILPQRIRPGTVVEKAPVIADGQQEVSEEEPAQETVRNVEKKYIIVGEDNEPGLTRQVKPVYGEARYVYGGNGSPYLQLLKNGLFAAHRSGRELELPEGGEPTEKLTKLANSDQFIPVQIISEPETQPLPELQITPSEQQVEVQQKALDDAGVPINVPVEESKSSEPVAAA